MEGGPLSSPEFKEFAKEVVLFCHITTRIPGRKDDDLLTKVGGRGFPHLVYMDETGKVLGRPARRSVKAFREGARYLTLSRKAELNQAETIELIELGLATGLIKPEDAKARAAKLEFDDAERARVDALIKTAEGRAKIAGLMGQLRSQQDVQAKGAGIGKQIWQLHQEGVELGEDSQSLGAYHLILVYAQAERQLEPAKFALEKLKAALGNEPRAKQFLQQLEQQVKQLEESLQKGE